MIVAQRIWQVSSGPPRDLMDGTAGPIERLIEQGNVVYGAWLDKTKPTGIDFEVLKGIGVLEKCWTSGVRKTVVPCGSREQAIMIRTIFSNPFASLIRATP
jgi:hypothetical protein